VAVSLDALIPGDGAAEVWPNRPVEVELSDSSDLDPALLEIIVDGTSCTVANGMLVTWQGSDAKELHAITQGIEWFDASGAAIAVEIVYDSSTLDAASFTVVEIGSEGGYCEGAWVALGEQLAAFGVGAVASFSVMDLYADLIRGELGYNVVDTMRSAAMDAVYYIATYRTWAGVSSGVVGAPAITDVPAAGIVEGWTPSYISAAGLVQAWMRHEVPAAGAVGVVTAVEVPASGIVGVVTATHGASAGIVYAVNRRNAVEVQVIDSTLYQTLTSAGVTWS
jgi:hypothetical protein